MSWTLEIEEIEHLEKIMGKLDNPEDAHMILTLIDKLSWISGWRQGVTEMLKLRDGGEK